MARKDIAAQAAGWSSKASFDKFRAGFNATFAQQLGPRQYKVAQEYNNRTNVLEINAQRGGWSSYKEYKEFRREWNKDRPEAQIRAGSYAGARTQLAGWESKKQYNAYVRKEQQWEEKLSRKDTKNNTSKQHRYGIDRFLAKGIPREEAYFQHSQVFNLFASSTGIVDKIDHAEALLWQKYYYVDVVEEMTEDEWGDRYGNE